MGRGLTTIFLALALSVAAPVTAQPALQQQVEARLRAAGPGPRFGLVVAAEDGRELIAINPDGRFIPASNTKLFTIAAAFATLPGLDAPDTAGGTAVRLESNGDVILEGRGDARLSSAPDCTVDCLATLADAVAARTRRVRNVIGDSSYFPDERWSPGMSWNNIHTRSGTGISALSLDDNELHLRVAATASGQPPRLDVSPYYVIENRASTVARGATNLDFNRLPGSNGLRLTGTILMGAPPELLRLGIDDPAHYAAWRFKTLLEVRGVRITGNVAVRREPQPANVPPLARLTPPPLAENLGRINKASQNVHAELLLRRLGRQNGTGSIADGQAVVRAMLARAGVERAHYDFSDGSGMSTYNRASPRGMVRLLRWSAGQRWAAAFRETLPIAGVDGTLASRFRGTPLEGRLFAKTGTLNASNALSGYLTAASGRILIFSFFANDVPESVNATQAMDAALVLVASQN